MGDAARPTEKGVGGMGPPGSVGGSRLPTSRQERHGYATLDDFASHAPGESMIFLPELS